MKAMNYYSGSHLTMDDNGLTDALGEINFQKLPLVRPEKSVQVNSESPYLQQLVQTALRDIEDNIVTDNGNTYFGAGRTFGAAVFTRDISFSGLLALNDLYPDIMFQSLKHTRKVRRETAFRVPHPEYIVEGIKADWKLEQDAADSDFPAGPITRRTDDVVWLWCAADLIAKTGNRTSDWQWLYDEGRYFFENIYQPFYDKTDGLYFGQASFIDVHFPTFKANGYPLEWSISDCVRVKATSTNALYKMGMDVMTRAAGILELWEESEAWKWRSLQLQQCILKELLLKDGTLAYYKDKNGNIPHRNEALGTAIAILTDVVSPEQARNIIQAYPVTEKGVPLLVPFFEFGHQLSEFEVHYDGVYHNNTSWPYVDGFFMKAREKALNTNTIPMQLALLARTCRDEKGFMEVVNFSSGKPFGSGSQLWSAAAFMNACLRSDLIH